MGFPFGCRMETLMETRSGCTSVNFWMHVADTYVKTLKFTVVTSYLLWWPPGSLIHPEA